MTTSGERKAQGQRVIELLSPISEIKELDLDMTEGNTMRHIDLEHISRKHLNELERCVHDLLVTMRKAKLKDEPLQDSLRLLEQKLGDARRERFDETNSEYQGY